MTGRRRLALPEPPGAESLPRADGRTLRGPWYRAHHPDFGAWYFASSAVDADEGGRFDLPDPHGTCYMAFSADVAVRERLGVIAAGRPLTAAALAASAISVMTVPPALFGAAGPAEHGTRRMTAEELADVLPTRGVTALLRRAADVIDAEPSEVPPRR